MPLAIPVPEMPEAKSKYFSVSIRPLDGDVDNTEKLKHALEMTLKLHTWAKSHEKCSGFYEDTTSLDILNPKPSYLAFHEPKLKSNLKTLLPEFEIARMTEEEFTSQTKVAKNYLLSPLAISDRLVRQCNVRSYNIHTIATKKTVSADCETTELLCTFTIDIPKRCLNDVNGMVSKISFENPDRNKISVFVNKKMLYASTHDNFIDFTISSLPMNSLSQGQLVQTIASGYSDQITKEKFPDFCDGNILSRYINMSRIDGLEITGLSDDAPITLECYTIMKSANNLPFAPRWTTYLFSV
jgi:hypothetical protein